MRASTRRTTVATLAGALALSGLAACGGSSSNKSVSSSTSGTTGSAASAGSGSVDKDPQKALTDALDKLGKKKATAVTVKLGATKEQLTAFAKATSDKFDATDQKIADTLAASSIQFQSSGGDSIFKVIVDGTPALTFIGKDKALYAQVAVKQIASKFGDASSIDQLTQGIPDSLSFIKDLVNGKYIEVDQAGLDQIKSLAGGLGGAASASASADAADIKNLQSQLSALLKSDLTATDAGSTDKGEHLVLSGNVKKVASDLQALGGDIPFGSTLFSKVDGTDVPDKTVKVDAYVNDNGLSALQLDLSQFDDSGKASATPLPIEVDFSDSVSTISAPSGATKVDVTKALSGLTGLFGAFSKGFGSS